MVFCKARGYVQASLREDLLQQTKSSSFSSGLTGRHRTLLLGKLLVFFVEIHRARCSFFSIGIACTADKVVEPQVILSCNDYNHATYAFLESDIEIIVIGYVLL